MSCTTARSRCGVGLHHDVGAEHRVLAECAPGLDPAVVADHDRPVDPGVGIDLGALAEPDAVADLEAGDLHLDPAVEDVLVGAAVGLEGADVLPVAVRHVPEEGLALVEQRREHVAGEVDRLARRRCSRRSRGSST